MGKYNQLECVGFWDSLLTRELDWQDLQNKSNIIMAEKRLVKTRDYFVVAVCTWNIEDRWAKCYVMNWA